MTARKVLIGCDVDPLLPHRLAEPPPDDIWKPLAAVPELTAALGNDLPPITWLIRADETVRHCTGDYASGYTTRRDLWSRLQDRGHELGWHMHLLSRDGTGEFAFDPEPRWLGDAHAALARHISIHATRTGWNYGSDFLYAELDRLDVALDFSALPGQRSWYRFGATTVDVNWLDTPETAYRPSRASYRRPGTPCLDLIQVPGARFRNPGAGMLKRLAWRLAHGCASLRGLNRRTRLITEAWSELPVSRNDVWVFYFHPEDLTPAGIRNLGSNVARLRAVPDVEFVTAGAVRGLYEERGLPSVR